ncbi:MAG: DNA-protecting protein DprA [Cytophagales bacterium]|nr:DNA-protecting protein DprA [Cytophagales bacterium]
MSNDTLDLLALKLIPGLGDKNIKQLVSYCGSPTEVFNVHKSKLMSIPGFGKKTVDIILNHQTNKQAETILGKAEKKGMDVLNYLDKSYPVRLRQVMDAPTILFKKGKGDFNPARTVAIVGTRRATNYGKEITTKIVEDLLSLNVQVISGLAYGIDIEAHKAAMKNNISTVSVLAGGLDWIYPSIHKKFAEDMQDTGGILSESPPGTKPNPHLFPARNRIIAGMADATIVVEAAERGGALITANIADSYNRTVFAVPGDIGHTHSVGTNKLIRSQKAIIYTGAEDLIYHLGWSDENLESKQKIELPDMNDTERVVYQLLVDNEPSLEIDILAMKAQIPINQMASILLGLEFKNLVKSMPGKKYGINMRK